MVSNEEFMNELGRLLTGDERVLWGTVRGDPTAEDAAAWRVNTWRPEWGGPPYLNNNYVCVSGFRRSEHGAYNRRSENFACALALMIDDVGTKLQPDPSWPRPTARIETSPGNEQWWYFLSERVTSAERWAAVQMGFVLTWAGGKDPGMKGVNRVGRLPVGRNRKPAYGENGWEHVVHEWAPERRFTRNELVDLFKLRVPPPEPIRGPRAPTFDADRAERAAEFEMLVRAMGRQGLFVKSHFGNNGRRPCLCPKRHLHTHGATTGSYLTEPSERNDWWGSFVCFHSSTHNDMNHLRDLKEVVMEDEAAIAANALDSVNRKAARSLSLLGGSTAEAA